MKNRFETKQEEMQRLMGLLLQRNPVAVINLISQAFPEQKEPYQEEQVLQWLRSVFPTHPVNMLEGLDQHFEELG